MDPKSELVQVDEMDIGLDRADITYENRIELPRVDSEHDHSETEREPEARSSSNLVSVLRERKHHVATKIRKTLHISKATDESDPQTPLLAGTADEASDSRLVHQLPAPDKPTVKDFLHNPIDTVKSKVSDQGNQQVAANMAAKEIAHGVEVDLINAYDAVGWAHTESERLLAIDDVKRLIRERQSTYARWSLDRHVTKIRILPRDTMVRRPQADFQNKDAHGQMVTNWNGYASHLLVYLAHQYGGQYVGFASSPPEPSKETIMPNIERLVVATSPLQEFIMTTRRVYRWENRAETTKYLVSYLVLWYLNLLLPGMLSVLLYLVLERRFHGNTLEDLREDIKHREDTQRTALSINEFIEKRGDDQWADDIIGAVGPWLMMQLGDLANLFESIRNFYEWRKPTRTGAVLCVLTLAVTASIFIPTRVLVKTATLSWGFFFFALFPIATNFPEYRLLVSPTKRLLWNIPTHAEWAIKYIQAEGYRHVGVGCSPTPPPTSEFGTFTAHHANTSGALVINASSLNRIMTTNLPDKLQRDSGQDLKLVMKSGQEHLFKDVKARDEAFRQIVGLSRTTWQVLW
ncbi:hypothetical protein ACEQ8H_001722 [Pleosporales sp. CAS-2024a]